MRVALAKPFNLTASEVDNFKSVGIEPTGNSTGKGLSCSAIEIDDAQLPGLADRLASLPDAENTMGSLSVFAMDHEQLDSILERAYLLVVLKEQQANSLGYGDDRPFAFDLHNTLDEINSQMQRLRASGIDGVQIGMEAEFMLDEGPTENTGFDKAEKVRHVALEKLTARSSQETEINARHLLTAQIDALKTFTPREILMYDLIENDPRTREILQPLFGTSRDGDGYYDAAGRLELKLKPVSSAQIIQNRKTLIQVLFEKAYEYGIPFKDYPTYHVSFSFWAGEENTLLDTHPQFHRYVPGIVAGIPKLLAEAVPVVHGQEDTAHAITLATDRAATFRYASGRIEARISNQSPDTVIPFVLAGAASGLEPVSDLPDVKMVRSPRVYHSRDVCKMVSHVINGSVLSDDGGCVVHRGYLFEEGPKIMEDLSIPLEGNYNALHGMNKELFYGLERFFLETRMIDADGKAQIIWPKTEAGNYEVIPGVSIDVGKLQDNVRASDITLKYVLDRPIAVPENTASDDNFYIDRMIQSPLLGRTLSKGFMEELSRESGPTPADKRAYLDFSFLHPKRT